MLDGAPPLPPNFTNTQVSPLLSRVVLKAIASIQRAPRFRRGIRQGAGRRFAAAREPQRPMVTEARYEPQYPPRQPIRASSRRRLHRRRAGNRPRASGRKPRSPSRSRAKEASSAGSQPVPAGAPLRSLGKQEPVPSGRFQFREHSAPPQERRGDGGAHRHCFWQRRRNKKRSYSDTFATYPAPERRRGFSRAGVSPASLYRFSLPPEFWSLPESSHGSYGSACRRAAAWWWTPIRPGLRFSSTTSSRAELRCRQWSCRPRPIVSGCGWKDMNRRNS